MSDRVGKVTPELARELKHESDNLDRTGAGIPHEQVRARWLDRMGRELRDMIEAYDGHDDRQSKELLGALVVAKEEGVPDLDDIMHALAVKMGKQRAA